MGVTVLGVQHNFYPRSPYGERHNGHEQAPYRVVISIHALLTESDSTTGILCFDPLISIHALLTESDGGFGVGNWPRVMISIHALLTESDNLFRFQRVKFKLFLSTLSLRRATVLALCSCGGAFDFYPRSPYGERRANSQTAQQEQRISIHALLTESDKNSLSDVIDRSISIHALLTESDASNQRERQEQRISIHALLTESDSKTLQNWRKPHISIHALLTESDNIRSIRQSTAGNFYPRSPYGERPLSNGKA